MMNVPGSRVHRSFMGDWRLNSKWANYSPFMGKVVNNQVSRIAFHHFLPPSFTPLHQCLDWIPDAPACSP